MKKVSLILVLTLIALLSISQLGLAVEVMKIGYAETADPYGHPTSAGLHVFKTYVEKLTGGELKVMLYPAGQLGDAKSLLEQVKRGLIQSCASIPSGMIASRYYNNFNIFDIPYLFRSHAVAWNALNPRTDFFQDISEDMAAKVGLRPLGFFIEGQRHFTNNVREIKRPDDLKGLKIRTMEVPAHMKMVEALGASPTPVSWLELYSALQTGVVDGQENPIGNILYLKGHEVQKYLTLDGHVTLLNTWVVNEKWFNKLTPAIKAAIFEAAQVTTLTNRGMAELKDTVGLTELKEKGMQVYSPTSGELNLFKEVTQQAVLPYIRENIDDTTWIERIQGAVTAAEKELMP